MAQFIVVTRDADVFNLDTGGGTLNTALDPKKGLIAKQLLKVKDFAGVDTFIPVGNIRRIYPQVTPPKA